jgi:hypothetical protein
MILSGSQLVWQSMNPEKSLAVNDGRCRICGGVLLGTPLHMKDFYSNNWTTENYVRHRASKYVCQPCSENKHLYSKSLGQGYLATRTGFTRFESLLDVEKAIACLPDEFVLAIVLKKPRQYRKHTVYDAVVGRKQEGGSVPALFLFPAWGDPQKPVFTHAVADFYPDLVLGWTEAMARGSDLDIDLNSSLHCADINVALAAAIAGAKKRQTEEGPAGL